MTPTQRSAGTIGISVTMAIIGRMPIMMITSP